MRAISHLVASTAAGAAAAAISEPSAGLGILLFGGFLDVDHLCSFVSSGLPLRPSALVRSIISNEKQLEKKYPVRRGLPANVLFPVLHCIELAMVLAAAGLLLHLDILLWGSAGLLLHLIMDSWSYPCSPWFFSMVWRLTNRKKLMKAWEGHRSGVYW
jgi:hypothetical protein